MNESDSVISANDIAGRPVIESYRCIGCGNSLIAKVNGEKMKPHFAHKIQVECSGESYLHKLGKLTFLETYKECLSLDKPFNIQLSLSKKCTKFAPHIIQDCRLGNFEKEFDLTNYFQEISIEKRDGQFIPDLLLISKKDPTTKIYIEIACTHFLSEEKEQSSNRIIEIPIETEDDLQKIRRACLNKDDALFIGFNQSAQAITESECHCANKICFGFIVYKNGKSNLEIGKLSHIHSRLRQVKSTSIYSTITLINSTDSSRELDTSEIGGRSFIEHVRIAAQRGVPIKNCYLCKYHGRNWDGLKGESIFCKTYKKTCGSNEAADCDRYRKDA